MNKIYKNVIIFLIRLLSKLAMVGKIDDFQQIYRQILRVYRSELKIWNFGFEKSPILIVK